MSIAEDRNRSTLASTRGVFIAAILLGSTGIVVGSYLDSAVISTAIPIFAMVMYFVVSWLLDRSVVDNPLFADSLYYLGFLLTLIALTVSLYLFGGDPDMEGIVYRFGIALVTTVLGLTGRILLASFNSSTEDSLQDAEAGLASAVKRLRERMDQFSVDLLAQQSAFNETLTNTLSEASAGLSHLVEESTQPIRTASLGLAETAQAGTAELNRKLGEHLTETGNVVRGHTQDLDRAFTDLTASVKNAELPADVFRAALEGPTKDLASAIATNSEEIRETLASLGGLGEQLHESLGRIVREIEHTASADSDSLTSALARAGESFSAAFAEFESRVRATPVPRDLIVAGLQPPLDDFAQSLMGARASVEAVTESNKDQSRTLALQVDAMAALVEQSQELNELLKHQTSADELKVFADLTQRVNGSLRDLHLRYGEYLKLLQEHSSRMTSLNQSVDEYLGLASSQRDTLRQHVNDASSAVAMIHGELVASANFLRQQFSDGKRP